MRHELPFLVLHGAIIAKLLVVAATAGGPGLVWLVRRKRDAKQARSELHARLGLVAAPTDGEATVRGTLREAGPQRWLDCAGERIDLEGEIRVVRGTRATWRRKQSTASQFVRDGDDVIASGQLARRPGDNAAASSYRSMATG